MTVQELIHSLKISYTLIDFITVVYCYLSGFGLTALNAKFNKVKQSGNEDELFEELDYMFDTLFFDNGILEGAWYEDFKESWLDCIKNHEDIADIICYETLFLFDKNYMNESVSLPKTLVMQGPLNTTTSCGMRFYNKPPLRYNDAEMKKNKIRKGRQYLTSNAATISFLLKKYEIIPDSCLMGYTPVVYKYNGKLDLDRFIIGIAPVEIMQYLSFIYKSPENIIDITYNPIYKNYILRKLIATLNEMENAQINFAIFPELFLFPNMAKELREYLASAKYENLKLIFTGSEWNNRKNTAYLFSANGTELISHTKKTPFDEFKNSVKYTENIESDSTIYLLDIEGVGRIAYLICKDALTGNLNHLCTSVLQANIVFISSFTKKTSAMLKLAESDAETKAITTVMCNSSSAVKAAENNDEYLMWYICNPKFNNKNISRSIFKQNKVPIAETDKETEEDGFISYDFYVVPIE